jgi:hypothetical protein
MLITSNIAIDPVTNIIVHFVLNARIECYSKFDYFHILMDFVIRTDTRNENK